MAADQSFYNNIKLNPRIEVRCSKYYIQIGVH